MQGENNQPQEYDYRISDSRVNEATLMIDRLPNRMLVKLAETAEELVKDDTEGRIQKAENYFNTAVLPGLKDFAEATGSRLRVDGKDSAMGIQVAIENEMGFGITAQCRCMRSLLALADEIGIQAEDGRVVLLLLYDLEEMMRCE